MAAVDVVDRLLEYVQNVYMNVDEEQQYYLFDKEIEEEKKEYEKWVRTMLSLMIVECIAALNNVLVSQKEEEFKHSTIAPLGLKKDDYVLRDIGTMEMDLESEDEEEEEEDNEEVQLNYY